MIVEPGLPDDPKYLRLKKAMKGLDPNLIALEVLVRLWGHCQLNQRGEFWPGADADYVEAVCRWDGDPGKLHALLVDKEWVEQEESGMRIHDWGEANAGIISRWENGKLGGRKKKRRTGDATPGKPAVNQPVNPRLTVGEPIEGKREGEIEGQSAHTDHFPEVSFPSEAEVLQECSLRGIAEETGRNFWRHYEGKQPKWRVNGEGFDWRFKLQTWHVKDREKTGEKKPPVKSTERADIRAELQWQKDPAKIEALKKRLRELEGE